MEWVRRNRGKAAVLSVFALLLLVALVRGVLAGGRGSSDAGAAVPLATPTAMPDHQLTTVPTPDSLPSPTADDAPAGDLPGPLGDPVSVGRSLYDGLRGQSNAQSIPSHLVELTLSSEHKLPFVIYNIPTSRDHPGGKSTDLGTTWSLATTVYGKPDYAQLFTRAGPEGYPITCQITVDGRVTARLTTGGPYGKIFCQG